MGKEAGTWTYHNSFLLADPSEAWVLETAGKCWAARRITQAGFNISNCLAIRTIFDRSLQGLQAYAQQKGLWDGQCEFDFAAAFYNGGAPPLGELTAGREASTHRLLQASAGNLDPPAMMAVLRDSSSGICMCDGGFRSNGSQVSQLARSTGGGSDSPAGQQHQHWFTATPDPQRSVYKPFAFPPASSSSGGSLRQQQPECSPHTAAEPAEQNLPQQMRCGST